MNIIQIKKEGLIFIDDISHIPYLKNKDRDNFYCEINNQETFEMILSIYSNNYKNLELNFSFFSSGLAIIRKLNNNDLNLSNRLKLRNNTIKNYLRILWNVIKKINFFYAFYGRRWSRKKFNNY